MQDSDLSAITAEQIAYYAARAVEYDAELDSRGRYGDVRFEASAKSRDIDAAEDALDALVQGSDVLELACGTGWWTRRLAARAHSVTAVDASAEMIAINRTRVSDGNVSYVVADIFTWSPSRRYDLVVFAFWLSHIPRSRFSSFWKTVGESLKPGGRVFVVDQQKNSSEAADEQMLGDDLASRGLRDGRTFRIVKVYWDVEQLGTALEHLGWSTRFDCPHGDVFHAVMERRAS